MNESFRRCCGQAAGIARAIERGDWLALEGYNYRLQGQAAGIARAIERGDWLALEGYNYRLQALLEDAREENTAEGRARDETVEALRGLSEGIDLTLQSVRTSTRSELDRLKLLAPLLWHLAERGGKVELAVQ